MRHTSREAWESIQRSGILTQRQKQAYVVLFEAGPMTGTQLVEYAKMPGLWKRLSELERAGVARRTRVVRCPVTDHNVWEWDVTAELAPTSKPAIKRGLRHDHNVATCAECAAIALKGSQGRLF